MTNNFKIQIVFLVTMIIAFFAPNFTSADECDKYKDLNNQNWKLQNTDPMLPFVSLWYFRDDGSILCQGDCDGDFGKPLSYNIDDLISKVVVSYEKTEISYTCKLKRSEEFTENEMIFSSFKNEHILKFKK